MRQLPVRSGPDVHLADAFGQPGCPLCRERARAEARQLESILAESVNDVSFRRELDDARGLCPTHAHAVLDADRRRSGHLGAAILLRAALRIRIQELESASAGGRSRGRRIEAAARPAGCPFCARMSRAEAGVVGSVLRLAAEPAWAEAVAAAPFCLDHLVVLMAGAKPSAAWAAIEARQLDRLRDLRDRLEALAHASSHDRRHRITPEERASVDEAARVLGGRRPDGRE